MTESILDPIDVPPAWHRFLYRSVLLEWETAICKQERFPRFSSKQPIAGISLVKTETLPELRECLLTQSTAQNQAERIFFFAKGKALKDLYSLIRNCVAHGHYSRPRSGWILLHHEYKGKLKLFGQVKFSSLQNLIALIAAAGQKLEA